MSFVNFCLETLSEYRMEFVELFVLSFALCLGIRIEIMFLPGSIWSVLGMIAILFLFVTVHFYSYLRREQAKTS